jgi:predicted metalloprotease with PDZ domain
MKRLQWPTGAAVTIAVVCAAAAQPQGQRAITLAVDLTDAPRKMIHATEILPVAPGPVTLVYPQWIPGEHAPSGPVTDLAGLVLTPQTAEGKPCAPGGDSSLPWRRDPLDMFAFHITVPDNCAALAIQLDYLATAAPTGFSAGASTSENLALLSWNTVVLYPASTQPADLMVTPSITMPTAWQFATALGPAAEAAADQVCPPASVSSVPCPLHISFPEVSLATLIDSPLLAGKYVKEIPLAPDVTPKHFLDIAADGPEDLNLPPERVAEFSRLVREAGALFGSRHYSQYHFLVTLSDSVAHFGLEHHESSDDRMASRTFTEDTQFILAGSLLPHEFTHSWNGKYRRPAGLGASDYQKPMVDDLLWVYEGLTNYLGDVLAARSGLWTPEQYRGMLAVKAATLDNWPGRTWRNLQDTADAAQLLYYAGGGWDNWRRYTDFYGEGELIWLDVDTTLRRLSGGKKSLEDFLTAFYGPAGVSPPSVRPYTFEDIVAALNAVAPNDWAAFLRERLDSTEPHAPLGGIVNGGYQLIYNSQPNPWSDLVDMQTATVDFWFSLGLHVNSTGTVTDVLKGGLADKAGVGPEMRLVAVNGRSFTPALLRAAVHDAEGDGPPIDVIAVNTGYYKVLRLDYHNGERYPTLYRTPDTPDTLDDILTPLTKH